MASQSYFKEARRAPGAEWIKNHPRFLERLYLISKKAFTWAYPLMKRVSPRLTERLMIRSEVLVKGWIFNCQMCGQCILHSTGMTCPMTCPKNLRNGPCGGVRENGNCEVIPDMPCVWVQAWQRSQQMVLYRDEMQRIQPPVNRSLQNTSAWINMVELKDIQMPAGWSPPGQKAID
jgi:hypothetical protein